uniref:Potassium channel tetramerization domain containing 19 n=1 Tax=Podarcis muralis TaxID=64176 RepID=A0A670KGI7_PODMU
IAQFPDSLIWKEVSALTQNENVRLFIDRDGYTFRHVHYYLHTSKLSFSSCAELNLLYEQAMLLQLTPLLQTLDNLKEGKHNLRVRPADIPIAERASMNYWRTRKCISKPSEFPLKSPAFTGLHEKVPLGLMDTPLLDTEEEVHYCFVPLDMVEKYPSLVNDDNLLWLSDNAVLIECESSEFRFIANFLRSEKMLLPDNFSNMDALEAEAEALGIPEVTEAVKTYRTNPGNVKSTMKKPQAVQEAASLPLFPMALGLLVKYPDSALGQLHMESTLDGNKLYISGNGVLFQHVMNWLGTCRLPLIRKMSELPELCAYLDQMDIIYEPMKDALKTFLKQKAPLETVGKGKSAVPIFSLHHIVKVYVGSHWYATYLQTLLKFPELLSNSKKVYWITYGQALLIHGDGQIFRHILNFLRFGKLFLPSEFKEWSLLCQEVAAYQIPSLVEALHQYDTYRYPQILSPLSFKNHVSTSDHSYIAVDLDQCANSWNISRNTQDLEERDRVNEKSPHISPTKGSKRRNNWDGYSQSTDGWDSSCCFRQPERKRGAKGNLSKKPENRDTPIQKLISLVQGWDMANYRCSEAQQVGTSNGVKVAEEPERRVPCNFPPATCFGVTSPELTSNGQLPKAGQCLLGIPDATSDNSLYANTYVMLTIFTHFCPGTLPEQSSSAIMDEPHGDTGLILKVEHPPIVACDGSCSSHESSILYSTHLEDMKVASGLAHPMAKDIVFLSFPLSQEEIFYARKCHCFLTDVILDSIRQKDPKKMTAKVELLVQRLWSLEITAKEFVADLLNVAPFKADSHACEKLLKWIEFTLPFAWKYSCCIDLLIKKGYFQSLSHFVIGKYLQKP